MADAVAPAAEGQEAPRPGMWGIISGILKQAMFFYFISSTMKGFFSPSGSGTSSNVTVSSSSGIKAMNLFPTDQLFDLYVYLDESKNLKRTPEGPPLSAPEKLIWMRNAMRYDDWTSGENQDGSYVIHKTFPTPEVLLRNESLYLHTFVVKTGQSPNPKDRNYFKNQVIYRMHQLNKYKKKYYRKTANLLTGRSEQSDEDLAKAEIMKYEMAVDVLSDEDEEEPRGGIEIGAGGGKMTANMRRHHQRERQAFEEEDLSSSDEYSGRPMPRYVGRDTDHVFGEFEMYDEDEDDVMNGRSDGRSCNNGDSDDDEFAGIEEEPVAELLPLGGGTRRVPRTPRRKNSSKCGFFDFYKLTDEHLGSGAYGSVTTCKSITSGEEFAVKIVDKEGETHSRKRILREVNIFKTCKGHPNIVQLLDWFEDDQHFYLVMEKMRGGPLLQHILQRGYFTEEEARRVTKDIASALKFMHDRGIAHRDVKPENVLCTDPDRVSPVKLCDLDLASQRPPQNERHPLSQVASEPDLASPVGSAEFMAPEVVDAFVGDALKYDKKCDTWSLGVILYIMLAGYAPFQGTCDNEDCGWSDGQPCEDCQQDLFGRIQNGWYEFPSEEWDMISSEAKDLVSRLLKRDPVERFNADQILSHRWLQQSAPSISLQTPCNLIYRKDSARDVQQMSEHFTMMNRLTDARLSARFDKVAMSESGTNLEGPIIHDSSFLLAAGSDPFATFPRKKSVGIAIEKSPSGEFTPPISRASPTTPPPSMLDLTQVSPSKENADDSGTYSMFSPVSTTNVGAVGSPLPPMFADLAPIQLFGADNGGVMVSSLQMTPRHTTEDEGSLKSFGEEQENAKPIRRIETQVNV